MFKALLLEKSEAGFQIGIRALDEGSLPSGDVPLAAPGKPLRKERWSAVVDTLRASCAGAWS